MEDCLPGAHGGSWMVGPPSEKKTNCCVVFTLISIDQPGSTKKASGIRHIIGGLLSFWVEEDCWIFAGAKGDVTNGRGLEGLQVDAPSNRRCQYGCELVVTEAEQAKALVLAWLLRLQALFSHLVWWPFCLLCGWDSEGLYVIK